MSSYITEEKHNCECGGKYTETNFSKHRNTIKHYNYMIKINPNYYQDGRHYCPCGGKYTQDGRFTHYETKIHINYLKLHKVDEVDEYEFNYNLYEELYNLKKG